MPDAKKTLYNAIVGRIADKAPSIKHTRLYNNQFNRDKEEEAFEYPNAFIEFSQMLWTSIAQGQQKCDINITVHVGLERLQTESLTVFDTINELTSALHGFASGVQFSPLNRIEEEQDIDHDNVIVWKVIFNTTLTECDLDTRAGLQTVTATLELNTDLDIDNPVIRTGDGVF